MANDNHFRVKNGIKVGDTEVVTSSAKITASIVNVSDTILPDKLDSIDSSISSLSAALGTYSAALSTQTLIENSLSAALSSENAADASLNLTKSSETAADTALGNILGYEVSALEDSGFAEDFKESASASKVAASTAKSAADLARQLAEQYRDSASSAKSAANSAKIAASASKSTAEARKESASAAKSSAESAKTSASAAKSSAESAKTSASASKSSAEADKLSASSAKSGAEAAKTSASASNSATNSSKISASSSQSSADSAKLAASAARSAANVAKQLAQGFKLTASSANSGAEAAKTSASAAKSSAESAKTSASAAKSSAESAKTSASASKSSAEADKLSASSAKSGAEAAKTSASAAKSSAESAKTSASAAKSSAESAKTSASAAKSSAESAKTSASAAKSSAESAKTSASAAKSSAESAKTSASAAKSSAESAKTSASASKSSAEADKLSASAAKSSAESAKTAASASKSTAEARKESASAAKSAAESAKTSASAAKSSAESAKTSASASKSSAEADKLSASAAKSGAETAKTAADLAKAGASSAQSAAESAKTSASSAKSSAESAKTSASAAKSSAESAKTAASASKSTAEARKESASAAKSAAESAKTSASASKSSAEADKLSASSAKSGAEAAKTSASAAKSSAESAKTSASAAKSSAESAKTSASASKSSAEADKLSASSAKSGAEAAKTSASAAKSSAESAKTSASAAKSSAESAKTSASASKSSAEADKLSASAAKSSAESAKTSASAAKSSAESAKTSASAAKSSAESAKTAASASKSTAEARKESASAAKSSAESAKTAADAAKNSASSAKSAAESSKVSASAAKSSAESAKTAASASKSTAEARKESASAAKSAAESAKTSASAAKSGAESAKTSASAAKSSAESAKTAASASKSTAEARKESASAAKSSAESAKVAASSAASTAQDRKESASSANSAAQVAKDSAVAFSACSAQAKLNASAAAAQAETFELAALNAKSSASGANVTALQASETAVSAKNAASADAVATAIHVINAEADAESTGALRTQIQDARFLEARVSRGQTGHFASGSWYLTDLGSGNENSVSAAKVVALQSGGVIFIEDLTTNTVTELLDNPTKNTIYSIPTLYGQTGDGYYKVYATVPIVVKNSRGSMAAPSGLATNYLGTHDNRDFPIEVTLFNPGPQTSVNIYAHSVCGSAVAATTFKDMGQATVGTVSIPENGYVTWSSGQIPTHSRVKVPNDDNDALSLCFASDHPVVGLSTARETASGIDFRVVAPMSNSEVLSAYSGDSFIYPRIVTGGINTTAIIAALIDAGSNNSANISTALHNILNETGPQGYKYGDIDQNGSIDGNDYSYFSGYVTGTVALTDAQYDMAEELIEKLESEYSTLKNEEITSVNNKYRLFAGEPETNIAIFGADKYMTACSARVYFASHGTGDGSGSDSEHGLPTPMLSDFYVFPDKHLSNFKIVSYLPNRVTITNKTGGTVAATVDHSGASKSNILQSHVGNNDGSGSDIGAGNGPYIFTGSAPFYLVCQSSDDDREITMLGARQAILNSDDQNLAVASRLDSVKSVVDTHSTSIAAQLTSINGIEANYTLKVTNNGAVTGFGFASSSASGINASSAFIVQADRFALSDAGTQSDLTLNPSSDTVPFEILNGKTKIKSAVIGTLNANSIEAGSITGQKISSNSRIEVYTEGNKTNTYAALDGADPLFRLYVGSDNAADADFSVTTAGKVKANAFVMEGFDGNYFDSNKGLGLAAMSQISDFVKSGRIATQSTSVVGNFDISDANTYTSITLPATSDVFQQYRLPVASLSKTVSEKHVGTPIHPWLINIGDMSTSGAVSLGDTGCLGPRQDFSVEPPVVVFDIPKNRKLQVGEYIKITWSNFLEYGSTLSWPGVVDADDESITFSQRPVGQSTQYNRDVLVKVAASSTNIGFIINRPTSGNIQWTPSDLTTKKPDVVGSARAGVPYTIKLKPQRYKSSASSFMIDRSPFDENGIRTYTAIEADDSFTDTDAEYRVLTTNISASYGMISATAYVDVGAGNIGAVDTAGYLTSYTTAAQSGDNALSEGLYRYGVELDLLDSGGSNLTTLEDVFPVLIETENTGIYGEFYVEPEPRAEFESADYDTIRSSVRPAGNSGFSTNSYGLAFEGESFLMIEHNAIGYSSANAAVESLTKHRQAIFLGNAPDDDNASSKDNLFVVADKPYNQTNYNRKMMLNSEGDMFAKSYNFNPDTSNSSEMGSIVSYDGVMTITLPSDPGSFPFIINNSDGLANFAIDYLGNIATSGTITASGGLINKGAIQHSDFTVSSTTNGDQIFSFTIPNGTTPVAAVCIGTNGTDFRHNAPKDLQQDSVVVNRYDSESNQDFTLRIYHTRI